jgi:hypothetical protein
MKTILINNPEQTEDQIYSNRIFFEECVSSIKKGLKNDDLIVPIVKLKFKASEFDLKIHRNEWNEYLDKCMVYFIGTEEYEICQEIKILLEI